MLYSYERDGKTVEVEDPTWAFEEWQSAETKGPTIRPLNDYVVVLWDEYRDRSHGGILYPSEDKMEVATQQGTVLSVGPGRYPLIKRKRSSKFIPTQLKPGEKVIAIRFAGYNNISEHKSRFRLFQEGEVIAVVESG